MKKNIQRLILDAKENLTMKLNITHADMNTPMSEKALKLYGKAVHIMSLGMMVLTLTCVPCFASNVSIPTDVVESMIDVILLVFRIIGVLMAVYSIGALVLAFKNEDPDAKTKNASMMVVSLVLIFLKTIVDATGIKSYIAGI